MHRVKAGLIGLVGLAAVYTLLAWAIGLRVQGQLQRAEQQLLGASGYLQGAHREYHRGLFGATEEVTWRLVAPSQSARDQGGRGRRAAWLFTLRSQIHHGPIAGGQLGLASIDTQLLAGDSASSGRPLLDAQTRLDWLGGLHSRLQSEPRGRGLSATAVRWAGLRGTVDLTQGMRHLQVAVTAPGLNDPAMGGGFYLGPVALQADLQRVFGALWIGQSSLQVRSLQLDGPPDSQLSLQGLQIEDHSSVSGEYLDQSAEAGAESLQIGQLVVRDLHYAQSASHLHGPTLASLVRALGQARQREMNAGQVSSPGMVVPLVRRALLTLALHAPVLQLTRLSFAMPQGQLRLSAQLAVEGLPPDSPPAASPSAAASGPAAPTAQSFAELASHLRLTAELSIDRALADQLLSRSPRTAIYAAQLEQLARQGYIREQNGTWSCRLAYVGGWLTLNDRPFPPEPAAPGP